MQIPITPRWQNDEPQKKHKREKLFNCSRLCGGLPRAVDGHQDPDSYRADQSGARGKPCLIQLYWEIGGRIVQRQQAEGWGKSVVERLASDVQKAFPGIEGFSSLNVWRMRAFYAAWSKPNAAGSGRAILSQAVTESDRRVELKSAQKSVVRKPTSPSTVVDTPPVAVSGIPWGHNLLLLFKLKDVDQRLWYAHETTVNGWSRSMLEHWIESNLYARQGKAVTNFKNALPPPQSDLANQIVRDPTASISSP